MGVAGGAVVGGLAGDSTNWPSPFWDQLLDLPPQCRRLNEVHMGRVCWEKMTGHRSVSLVSDRWGPGHSTGLYHVPHVGGGDPSA